MMRIASSVCFAVVGRCGGDALVATRAKLRLAFSNYFSIYFNHLKT